MPVGTITAADGAVTWITCILVGAALGSLLASSAFPRTDRLTHAAALVLTVALGVFGWMHGATLGGPAAAGAGAGVVVFALTASVRWRNHPSLADVGFWQRTGIVVAHGRRLLRTRQD